MILSLLLACPNAQTVDEAAPSDAWPGWNSGAEDSAQEPAVVVEEEEVPEIEYAECEPKDCIELAEAVDRGFAAVHFGRTGLEVDNAGPYPICFDGWYTFLSGTSQDAVGGTTRTSSEIPSEEALLMPYAEWGDDEEAWWCVEHNQYTSNGAEYSFNGSRAPTRIADWTNDASDEDEDNAEDHVDAHPDDDLPQTQHNLWDYIADRPVFIVGRQMNWFEVAGNQTVEVVLVVHNLGREDGAAQVMEKVPEGWTVSTVTPTPTRNEIQADGSTMLAWAVELEAAVEPSNTYSPTEYDIAEVSYRLTYQGPCAGREIGYAPTAAWLDNAGSAWVSEGAPLVIECCDSSDSALPGSGGGLGP